MRAFLPNTLDEAVAQKEQSELIEIFCSTGPIYVEALRIALEHTEPRHPMRFAHTLKETIDCLKVESLSKMAASLENLVASGQKSEAQFLLRRLETLLSEMKNKS